MKGCLSDATEDEVVAVEVPNLLPEAYVQPRPSEPTAQNIGCLSDRG